MRNNDTLKENIVKLLYRIVNNLLYFDDNEKEFRFYISTTLKV